MRMFRNGIFLLLVSSLAISGALAGDVVVRHAVDETLALALPSEDGVTAPRLKSSSARTPRLPGAALDLGKVSTVTMALVVRADGSVGRVEPIAVQHPGMGFEASAVRSMQNWRYEPAQKNGQAVDSLDVVTVLFPPASQRAGELPGGYDFMVASAIRDALFRGDTPLLPKGYSDPDPGSFTPTATPKDFLTVARLFDVKEGELYNRNPPSRQETPPTDGDFFFPVPPNVGIRPGG